MTKIKTLWLGEIESSEENEISRRKKEEKKGFQLSEENETANQWTGEKEISLEWNLNERNESILCSAMWI